MSHLRTLGHSIFMTRPRLMFWRRRRDLSAIIWAHFIAQPDFRDEVRRALLDRQEGRAIPLREIPRDR